MADLITSTANSRIKDVVALRDRKYRDDQRRMLVEGTDELELALLSSARPITLFYCADMFGVSSVRNRALIDKALVSGVEVVELGEQAFSKCAYRGDGSDGLLAIFAQPKYVLADLAIPRAPLILVIDGVEKPGNLGAMLRTADAVGASAVVCCDIRTDLSNPNVIRASKGAIFTIPIAVTDAHTARGWLAVHQLKLLAATPAAEQPYAKADMTGGVAIIVGEEKYGLGQGWLGAATELVRIPMHGVVNSLNVATSAAVLLYEADRQRGLARYN